mmetsp:Transcript_92903/g.178420  ORF Transcript_92903/g.178420 Transcript_92903/m.178420 type:complete len:218 (-) Transcript_92903:66-719(-)
MSLPSLSPGPLIVPLLHGLPQIPLISTLGAYLTLLLLSFTESPRCLIDISFQLRFLPLTGHSGLLLDSTEALLRGLLYKLCMDFDLVVHFFLHHLLVLRKFLLHLLSSLDLFLSQHILHLCRCLPFPVRHCLAFHLLSLGHSPSQAVLGCLQSILLDAAAIAALAVSSSHPAPRRGWRSIWGAPTATSLRFLGIAFLEEAALLQICSWSASLRFATD